MITRRRMATTIQGATKGFSREAVEELSHRRNEPDWLREKRVAAWEQYEQIPMPKRTDEEWRRTDIRMLPIDDVTPFGETRRARRKSHRSARLESQPRSTPPASFRRRRPARLGNDLLRGQSEALASQGVIFSDLDTAIREHPELLQKYFMTDEGVPASENKFAALHGAFWTTGIAALRSGQRRNRAAVPRLLDAGVRRDSRTFNHVLIVAEEFANVTLVDYYQSETLQQESIADNVDRTARRRRRAGPLHPGAGLGTQRLELHHPEGCRSTRTLPSGRSTSRSVRACRRA